MIPLDQRLKVEYSEVRKGQNVHVHIPPEMGWCLACHSERCNVVTNKTLYGDKICTRICTLIRHGWELSCLTETKK